MNSVCSLSLLLNMHKIFLHDFIVFGRRKERRRVRDFSDHFSPETRPCFVFAFVTTGYVAMFVAVFFCVLIFCVFMRLFLCFLYVCRWGWGCGCGWLGCVGVWKCVGVWVLFIYIFVCLFSCSCVCLCVLFLCVRLVRIDQFT